MNHLNVACCCASVNVSDDCVGGKCELPFPGPGYLHIPHAAHLSFDGYRRVQKWTQDSEDMCVSVHPLTSWVQNMVKGQEKFEGGDPK